MTLKEAYPEIFDLYVTYPPLIDRACFYATELDKKRLMTGVLQELATHQRYAKVSCQFDAFAVWLFDTDAISKEKTEDMEPVKPEYQPQIIGESQTLLAVLRCIETASHRVKSNTKVVNALVVELSQLYKIFNVTLLQ